jgi:hypothetical protein
MVCQQVHSASRSYAVGRQSCFGLALVTCLFDGLLGCPHAVWQGVRQTPRHLLVLPHTSTLQNAGAVKAENLHCCCDDCMTPQVIDTDAFEVVVVSPRNHFVFTPMLPSTAVGTVEFR